MSASPPKADEQQRVSARPLAPKTDIPSKKRLLFNHVVGAAMSAAPSDRRPNPCSSRDIPVAAVRFSSRA
jgi:hypothetical protein